MLLIFLVAHLVATEYIPAQQGRGEILMFRKSGKKDHQRTADEESPNAACYLDLIVSKKDNKGNADSGYLNRGNQDVFYWTNVDFSVKISSETRNILTGIEGWVQPGTLTALMVRCYALRDLRRG
jgi:ATP-binding cassette subfamily G (WHITE) protein 2 (PDR)